VRSTPTFRFARVDTSNIEARLGSEIGHIVNVSATGALLRMHTDFRVGRSCPLFLNVPGAPVSLIVRIVRTERITPDEDAAASAQQLVGVMFTEFSSTARQAIAKLCGASFHRHE
jgi:hypothetical protein